MYTGPVVDCDIHHDWPSQDALLPYLSPGWREYATRSGGRQPMPVIPSEIHPNPGGVFRDDAWPEEGGPPGSSHALMEAQLLDRRAQVREHRGGLPTMTADGQHIVGPAPGLAGFYFAGGCNVAGLSLSPALGEHLAAWIVDGAPPVDLSPLMVHRFAGRIPPDDELRRDAAWQYRHFYGAA